MKGKNIGGPVAFEGWNWGVDISDLIGKAVTATIKDQIKRDGVLLRVCWERKGGLRIGAELPFGRHMEEPIFGAKLKDIINEEVEFLDGEVENIEWLRDELQGIVNDLNRRLARL